MWLTVLHSTIVISKEGLGTPTGPLHCLREEASRFVENSWHFDSILFGVLPACRLPVPRVSTSRPRSKPPGPGLAHCMLPLSKWADMGPSSSCD